MAVAPAAIGEATLIVAFGWGMTVKVNAAEAALLQPLEVTTTV